MPRKYGGVVRQYKQLSPDRVQQRFMVPARKVRSADAHAEQCISPDQCSLFFKIERDTAGRMSGNVERPETEGTLRLSTVLADQPVRFGCPDIRKIRIPSGTIQHRIPEPFLLFLMKVDRNPVAGPDLLHCTDMVEVGMGQVNGGRTQLEFPDFADQLPGFLSGIENQALAVVRFRDITVCLERAKRVTMEFDHLSNHPAPIIA